MMSRQSPKYTSKIDRARRVAMGAVCVLTLASGMIFVPGCVLGTLIGGVAQSYKETTPVKVEAEYRGLEGKSFAVLVTGDRTIDVDYTGLIAEVSARIDERLAEFAGASGHVPVNDVLAYSANNPSWPAKPRAELAKSLGNPQRLVLIEINEFRLNDPGNGYLWSGAAGGTITVLELDGPIPEEAAFEKQILVTFPDQQGAGPAEFSRDAIISVLLKRFVDRTTWTFYNHEEMYDQKY